MELRWAARAETVMLLDEAWVVAIEAGRDLREQPRSTATHSP